MVVANEHKQSREGMLVFFWLDFLKDLSSFFCLVKVSQACCKRKEENKEGGKEEMGREVGCLVGRKVGSV